MSPHRLLACLAAVALAAPVVSLVVAAPAVADAGSSAAVVRGSTGASARAGGDVLAFVRNGRIFSVRANGSQLTQLTSFRTNTEPVWSPDGSRIAYVHEDPDASSDVWVMDADGTHKKQLTDVGDVVSPAWQPDGQSIAFAGAPRGTWNWETWARCHGKDCRPVLGVSATAPHGTPVAVRAEVDGEQVPVETLNASLAWAPDGVHLTAYNDDSLWSPDFALWVFDTEGDNSAPFSYIGGECCGQGRLSGASWSPAGDMIAYDSTLCASECQHEMRPLVFVNEYPSRNVVPLPQVRGDSQPDFSPSGDRIVVTHRNRETGERRLVLVDLDDGGRTALVAGQSGAWRPAA